MWVNSEHKNEFKVKSVYLAKICIINFANERINRYEWLWREGDLEVKNLLIFIATTR